MRRRGREGGREEHVSSIWGAHSTVVSLPSLPIPSNHNLSSSPPPPPPPPPSLPPSLQICDCALTAIANGEMGLTVHAGGEFDAHNKYHDPYQLTSLVVGMAAKLSVLGPTRVLFAGPEALETSLNHMRQLIQLVRAPPSFPPSFPPSLPLCISH